MTETLRHRRFLVRTCRRVAIHVSQLCVCVFEFNTIVKQRIPDRARSLLSLLALLVAVVLTTSRCVRVPILAALLYIINCPRSVGLLVVKSSSFCKFNCIHSTSRNYREKEKQLKSRARVHTVLCVLAMELVQIVFSAVRSANDCVDLVGDETTFYRIGGCAFGWLLYNVL